MLTYSFLEIGSESLYKHLYQCIKKDIMAGTLAPGTRLPSKRSFAKHLDISVITVENAYAQLIAEGYIFSIPKKGFYVAQPPESGWWKLPDSLRQNDPFVTTNPREAKNLSSPGSDCSVSGPAPEPYYADFLSNHTRVDNFPFSIWAKLMREVLTEEKESLLLPPPSGGILPLRRAIADHLCGFRGMHVQPEQIIIGAGTEYLYELLIQLLGRDKIVGLENPGYGKISRIYQCNNVCCRYLSMDENGLNHTQLMQSDVDILHLSPSHHYPTGIVTPIGRRYELLGWAAGKKDRYIIEDDYDCEFRLLGTPIPALLSIDVMEKVIYINTFTKSLSSTIRISYMILPAHLLELFYKKLGFYACTVSNFEQYTLAKFIHEGYFEKHINRMRSYYREQRDRLIAALKKYLPAPADIREEDAGLHFLLNVQTPYTDEELIQRAQAERIRISCLSQYMHSPDNSAQTKAGPASASRKRRPALYKNTLIINYSGIHPDRIEPAVRRLVKCLT